MRQDQRLAARRNHESASFSRVRMNECTRKHSFRHEKEAAANARKLQRETGYTSEAYKCRFCNRYHVGRRKQRLPGGQVIITRALAGEA